MMDSSSSIARAEGLFGADDDTLEPLTQLDIDGDDGKAGGSLLLGYGGGDDDRDEDGVFALNADNDESAQSDHGLLTQSPVSDRRTGSDTGNFALLDDYSHGSISDQSGDDTGEESDEHSTSEDTSGSDSPSDELGDTESDESAALEQDLRDIDTTPRIVRNRRRAIQRNQERLRLLMEGVDRPGAQVTQHPQQNGSDVVDASRPFRMTNGENGHGERPAVAGRKRKRSIRPSQSDKTEEGGQDSGRRRGMLFATRFNNVATAALRQESRAGMSQGSCGVSISSVTGASLSHQQLKHVAEEVGSRFLCREAQIRLLCSIFENTIRQGTSTGSPLSKCGSDDIDHDDSFVPSPVFVTGPSGAGKTSIVRDILQSLKRRHASAAATARTMSQEQQQHRGRNAHCSGMALSYVDCSTVEGSAAGAFLEEAYKQMLRSFFSSDRRGSRKSRRRRRHGSPRKYRNVNGASTKSPVPGVRNDTLTGANSASTAIKSTSSGTAIERNDQATRIESGKQSHLKLNGISSRNLRLDRKLSHLDEDYESALDRDHDEDDEGFGDIEEQIEKQKKDHLNSKPSIQQASGRQGATMNPGDSALTTKRHHAINSPSDFGRALEPLFGRGNHKRAKSKYGGCGFLVLDQADRLLSMTAKQNSPYLSLGRDERNNLLSQLLLLPRVMALNLTIVVITTNSLLEFGRTNNVHLQPSNSLGTIQDAIHPIRVRFHGYRGKQIYRSILLSSMIKENIIGCESVAFGGANAGAYTCQGARWIVEMARDRLYSAMITTVLQSLEGVTRDVREMLRLARVFWPIYISPLTTVSATATDDRERTSVIKEKFCLFLATASNQDQDQQTRGYDLCQEDFCSFCRSVGTMNGPTSIAKARSKIDKVLEMLDIKARKSMREIMSKCLFTPVQNLDSIAYPQNDTDATYLRGVRSLQTASMGQLSYMSKFLLLSAYLCQNNRQEQDLALFTNHNKGKRRKGKAVRGSNTADVEGDLYASSAAAQQHLRSLRLVTFPLERMLSVFSSILSKYGNESEFLQNRMQDDGYLNVARVGSARLFECIAELRDSGLLCDMSGPTTSTGSAKIDMAAKKFTCTLSNVDALALAREVDVPLQKYMLQER